MIALITFTVGYWIAKKLNDSSDYKQPKGKHKNRYR